MLSHRKKHGFTIIELLIVIVAILAAITLVAYNGVQQRAKNSQTLSTVEAYAKAISMYVVDNGSFPPYYTCLGMTYGYGVDGDGTSGYQCRQDTTTSGITVSSAFYSQIAPYINSTSPQADTGVTYVVSSTNWYRGAYYYPATPHRIDFVLEGNVACPSSIRSLSLQGRSVSSDGSATRCIMNFGDS